MDTVLICCETIELEIKHAISHVKVDYPIIWLESGLHNNPELLHDRLQEEFDGLPGEVWRVIMCFGFCGNSMAGLRTREFELILPRADDCITLLLGSFTKRLEASKDGGMYFMTRGWLNGGWSIGDERKSIMEQYGEEVGKMISQMMFSNYTSLGVLDTGAYELESILDRTSKMAEDMGFEHKIIDAGVDYIEELLTGPWPEERFYIAPPNSLIKAGDLTVLL